MEWVNVKDSLPEPWTVVWIYWRDREVLLGCRTYEGRESKECDPTEGWYSFDYEKCRHTNWWMPINGSSYDKPPSPDQPERSKREDSCKHELYPEEYKEEKEGYIFRNCKKCDEKLYVKCL
jgi:hypothetical protein